MKLKSLAPFALAFSLTACIQRVESENPQDPAPVVDTINAANLRNLPGAVEEFTPKGNPNYVCVVYHSGTAIDVGVSNMQCFPKAGTPAP
jgi:hypothetical protein